MTTSTLEYNSKNNISIKITDKEDNLFAEDVKTCNYQIHREMAPIYTLGNKPFERKQTIAGTLVFDRVIHIMPKVFNIIIQTKNEEDSIVEMRINNCSTHDGIGTNVIQFIGKGKHIILMSLKDEEQDHKGII